MLGGEFSSDFNILLTCLFSPTRLLLWDCDDRSYCYYIEVSNDQKQWTRVVDKSKELSR